MARRVAPDGDGTGDTGAATTAKKQSSAELGARDGLIAAQAIALVFLSRFTPGLAGAAQMAGVGLSSYLAEGFLEAMAERAYGSDWPVPRNARPTYLRQFVPALRKALESEATVTAAVRDLVFASVAPSIGPKGSEMIFRWVHALVALQEDLAQEESRLQAERQRDFDRGLPPIWLLPPARELGRTERWAFTQEFSIGVEPRPGTTMFDATVLRRTTGLVVYRAAFPNGLDAERAAAAFASVLWQISHIPAMQAVENVLLSPFFGLRNETFGTDWAERLQAVADRSDRVGRGYGVGPIGDHAWLSALSGDVDGVLASLPTRPFGW